MELTRYLGCLGLIKPEVDLIRTILRTSSRLNNRWLLAEHGECDALLVYNTDKSFSPFTLKQSTQLIIIRRRGEKHEGHVFYKPFRADELIDTLISIESSSEESHVVTTVINTQPPANFYRLKRWPPADVLAHHKNFMLLAVYLSRGAKTLQDLVTLSGQGEALCNSFITLLQDKNLLHIENGAALQTTIPIQPSTPVQQEKAGFFSQLRARLGLNKK